MPCVAENKKAQTLIPQPPPVTEEEIGVTPIGEGEESFIEGFNVTPLEDYQQFKDQIGSGNTRPDNVLFVEEPVTFL